MTPKYHIGDYLGDLTDEFEKYGSCSFVEEFVSAGPKNYAFSVFCPSTGKRATKCKVKGIMLNYSNSKVVNFTTLRDMFYKTLRPCMYTIRGRSIGNIVV